MDSSVGMSGTPGHKIILSDDAEEGAMLYVAGDLTIQITYR